MNRDALPFRLYDRSEVAGFQFTKAVLGPLSNMGPGGFEVNGVFMKSSEHYFQVLKFPGNHEAQKEIVEAATPMESKKAAWRFSDIRPDWDQLEICGNAMRHAIRLKLAFNRELIMRQFEIVGNRQIVEISSKDDFWGAVPVDGGKLRGRNLLGRLHLELMKETIRDPNVYADSVPAPAFPDALLFGEEIGEIIPPRVSIQSSLSL